MVDLVLKVVRLECHGGENCGLLPWGVETIGHKRRADGPGCLRSSAAFRRERSARAGRRFGSYGGDLGLCKSWSGRSRIGSRQSESSGDEQRQRWVYEVREHGVTSGVGSVNESGEGEYL